MKQKNNKNCSEKKPPKKGMVAESAALEKEYGNNLAASEENFFVKLSDDSVFSGGECLKKHSVRNYTGEDPQFGKKEAEKFASGKLFAPAEKQENPCEKYLKNNTERNFRIGHRQRLRARYMQAGDDGMTDYDVLELLLTYCIPQKDVRPLARDLLEKFKTLGGVLDAELEDVCKISGISENSALLFRIQKDLCCRYLKEKMLKQDVMSSPERVKDFARMKLGGYKEEAMLGIYLNTRNHVIEAKIISRGTVDNTVVYPRNIAAEALALKASGVILVHNHPAGSVTPSAEDMEFTRMVKTILASLEISLLDHLIVSKDSVYSFHEKRNIL